MEWGYRLKARRIIKKDLICVKDSSQQAYLFLISDMLNIFTMLAFTALCIASLIVLGFLGDKQRMDKGCLMRCLFVIFLLEPISRCNSPLNKDQHH